MSVKAARKTLMKLTPGRSYSSLFHSVLDWFNLKQLERNIPEK